MKTITIAVIGDNFILTENFITEIKKNLPKNSYSYKFISATHDWPNVPMQYNNEIQEFTGATSDTLRLLKYADIAAIHMAPITNEILEKSSKLKLISTARGGVVNVNLESATRHNVIVTNAPGRNARAVAEFTISLMIHLAKAITNGHYNLTSKKLWKTDLYDYKKITKNLHTSTVGLIGMGQVGKITAKLLQSLGSQVLYYDPYTKNSSPNQPFESCDLAHLLQKADIVSLHARHSNQKNKPLLGEKELQLMKKGATLIQTSRSSLLDYDALYRQLKNGHLSGAALDVYPQEPIPHTDPFSKLENIILTPHIAGSSKDSAITGIKTAASSIGHFLKEEKIDHQIN